MKTNAKKRMLISSVAMLLVAMIALGTATFAWFSTSTTTKANNIKVQTIQASNLLIRKGNDGNASSTDWATQIDYSAENPSTLEPASTTDLNNWFKALATSYNQTGEKAGSIEAIPEEKIGGYRVEKPFQLYYKAETTEPALSVNWGISIAKTVERYDDFIRIAIIDSATGDPVFVYGKTADGDSLQYKEGSNTDIEHSGATNVTETTTSGSLTSLAAGAVKSYKLVVWYEGTDPQCIDTNAVTLNDISLTFSKAA